MALGNYSNLLGELFVLDKEQERREPCWISGAAGFSWLLLTSAYIIAFIFTLLLVFQMHHHYQQFGRRYRRLYKHWHTSRSSEWEERSTPEDSYEPFLRRVVSLPTEYHQDRNAGQTPGVSCIEGVKSAPERLN